MKKRLSLILITGLVIISSAAMFPCAVIAQNTYHSGYAYGFENPSADMVKKRFTNLFKTHGHPTFDAKVWRFGPLYAYRLYTLIFNQDYAKPGEPSLTDEQIVGIIAESQVEIIPDDYTQYASIQRYTSCGVVDLFQPDETGKTWFKARGIAWTVIYCANGVMWFAPPIFVPVVKTVVKIVTNTVTKIDTQVVVQTNVEHDTVFVNSPPPQQYEQQQRDEVPVVVATITLGGQQYYQAGYDNQGHARYCKGNDWQKYCQQNHIQRSNGQWRQPRQYAHNNYPSGGGRHTNPGGGNYGGAPIQGKTTPQNNNNPVTDPNTGAGSARGPINNSDAATTRSTMTQGFSGSRSMRMSGGRGRTQGFSSGSRSMRMSGGRGRRG